jgi:hypothetical protein
MNATEKWAYRKFGERGWEAVLRFMETAQITGVVLGVGCEDIDHPLVLNLSDKTNILEAIEISKGCSGYIGVDSIFSVIAAKVAPRHRVLVKTKPGVGIATTYAKAYYAPNGAVLKEFIDDRTVDEFIQNWFK